MLPHDVVSVVLSFNEDLDVFRIVRPWTRTMFSTRSLERRENLYLRAAADGFWELMEAMEKFENDGCFSNVLYNRAYRAALQGDCVFVARKIRRRIYEFCRVWEDRGKVLLHDLFSTTNFFPSTPEDLEIRFLINEVHEAYKWSANSEKSMYLTACLVDMHEFYNEDRIIFIVKEKSVFQYRNVLRMFNLDSLNRQGQYQTAVDHVMKVVLKSKDIRLVKILRTKLGSKAFEEEAYRSPDLKSALLKEEFFKFFYSEHPLLVVPIDRKKMHAHFFKNKDMILWMNRRGL